VTGKFQPQLRFLCKVHSESIKTRHWTPFTDRVSGKFATNSYLNIWPLCVRNLLHVNFHERLENDLKFHSKDLGFEETLGLEIWLNDLKPFLERFLMWAWDVICCLPITVCYRRNHCLTWLAVWVVCLWSCSEWSFIKQTFIKQQIWKAVNVWMHLICPVNRMLMYMQTLSRAKINILCLYCCCKCMVIYIIFYF